MTFRMEHGEIGSLRRQAEEYWGAVHEEMAQDLREIDLGPEVTLKINGVEQTTINPRTAAGRVRSAASHLIDGDVDLKVDAHARSEAAKNRGTEIANALKAILYHQRSVTTGDPHYGEAWMAAATGMGVNYVGANFERLEQVEARKPEEPKRKKGESKADWEERQRVYEAALDAWNDERDRAFPIVVDHEDPREIFPDPGTWGQKWVMKICRRTVGDIRRQWPGWEPKKRGGFMGWGATTPSDFETVEWLELWSSPGGLGPEDPGSYYYEADGIPIKRFNDAGEPEQQEVESAIDGESGPWPNAWGFCPYTVWPAGYGAPRGKPEEVFKGLIRDARKAGLFKAKAEKMSQMHTISRNAAWFAWAVPQGYGEDFTIGIGDINEFPVDQNGRMVAPQAVTGPVPPREIYTEMTRLEAEIDAHTVPSILATPGSDDADVALLFARRVQEASVSLGPLKQQMELGYNQKFDKTARLLANPVLFGEDEVFQIVGENRKTQESYVAKVSRKLFQGQHAYQTKIDPKFPEDQAGKIQSGLSQLRDGAIDLETHLEKYAGDPNPKLAAARAGAYQVLKAVMAGDTTSPMAAFLWAFMSGKLPRDVKAVDFLRARMQAETEAATAAAAGGGMGGSTTQMPNATGGPMAAGGGGGVAAEIGASQAFSEQTATNGQGAYQ